MDLFYSIVGFFVTGGPFMYPILIVFAVGAAFAIERYITLTKVTVKNQSAWSRVQPALMNGEFDEAREMTSKDDSAISQLLGMGLARQGAVRRHRHCIAHVVRQGHNVSAAAQQNMGGEGAVESTAVL